MGRQCDGARGEGRTGRGSRESRASAWVRVAYTRPGGNVDQLYKRADVVFFFSSRRRHTRFDCDWSSDVCSSDLRLHCLPRHPEEPRELLAGLEPGAGLELAGEYRRANAGGDLDIRRARVRAGDRKSVVEGKRGDLGGRRIIKKKKINSEMRAE